MVHTGHCVLHVRHHLTKDVTTEHITWSKLLMSVCMSVSVMVLVSTVSMVTRVFDGKRRPTGAVPNGRHEGITEHATHHASHLRMHLLHPAVVIPEKGIVVEHLKQGASKHIEAW
jgi:hypothetical protein